MALRAKYEADFQEFYGAVAQANAGLETWEQTGGDVERQMDAIASSLTGAPVVNDTNAAADAMGDLGTQAGDVPDKMRAIGDEGQKLPPIFGQIAGAVAGAFTVQQLINFGVGVVQAAGQIGDLSERLGISMDAVQRFTFAAEQGGSTIGAVERAIGTMNRTLAEGSDSTIEALAEAGLQFDDIRAMKPEDAFTTIADAIGEIEDPMTRAKVAVELFGKAGQELLPVFVAGIEDVGRSVATMSDDTVRDLKAAEDQWNRLKTTVTVYGAEVIKVGFDVFGKWQEASELLAKVANPFTAITSGIKDFELTADAGAQAASDLGAMIATIPAPKLAEDLKPVAISGAAVTAVIKDMDAALQASNKTVKATTAEVSMVEPKLSSFEQFTRRAEKATKDVIPATETWNSGLRFTSEVIGELVPELEQAATAIESVTTAQQQMTAAVSKNAPGSVGVNLGGLQFGTGGLDAAMKQYTARYGGGAMGGFIGGGPAPDFLSFAKSMGLASPTFPAGGVAGGGAAITNTFNIVDTESEIARRVSEEIARQIQRGSLVT